MPLAYSYSRYSSAKQRDNKSIERQVRLRNDWIAANQQYNLTLADDYRDLAKSMFTGAALKGRLGQLVSDVEHGLIPAGSWLIVESLDRLSRQKPMVAAEFFLRIVNSGITIVTILDNTIYSDRGTGQQQLIALYGSIMVLGRAHDESATKSERRRERWTLARAAARTTGADMRASCPAWLSRGPDGWVINNDAVATIIMVFEMSADGVGSDRVARNLVQRDVRAIGRSGKWSSAYVRLLLSNRAVLGELQPGRRNEENGQQEPDGEPILGYYPSIVSKHLWDCVQRVRSDRRTDVAGIVRADKAINLLSGLVKCGTCGASMFKVQGPNGAPHLRCGARVKFRTCDNAVFFRLDHLERAVLRDFGDRLRSAKPYFQAPAAPDAGLTELQANMSEVERRVVLLKRRLEDEEDDALASEIKQQMRDRLAEKKVMTANFASLKSSADRKRELDLDDEATKLQGLIASALNGEPDAREKLAAALRRLIDVVEIHQNGIASLDAYRRRLTYYFDRSGTALRLEFHLPDGRTLVGVPPGQRPPLDGKRVDDPVGLVMAL